MSRYESLQRRKQSVVIDEDIKFDILSYKDSPRRQAIYMASCILTFGGVPLICRWIPKLYLHLTCVPCSIHEADKVFIINQWGEVELVSVKFQESVGNPATFFEGLAQRNQQHASNMETPSNSGVISFQYFEYNYYRFIFHPGLGTYETVAQWIDPLWTDVDKVIGGLSGTQVLQRKSLFGQNEISIKEKSTMKLLTEEVLNPFYIFQIFSIILWSIDNYYYYAGCILFISTLSVVSTLIETKRTLRRLKLMSKFSCNVATLRNGDWVLLRSEDLVPGDVISLDMNNSHILACDAILLDGECIVNESMLTGESVPVSKYAISSEELSKTTFDVNPSQNPSVAKFYLFAGTKLIRARPGKRASYKKNTIVNESIGPFSMNSFIKSDNSAMGLVVRTGFNTEKANLIRSMMFPKPNQFQFYRDSFRFIGFLSCIAVVGFLISSVNFFKLGVNWSTIFIRALDLITIVVPPALPATMSIGTSFAISRLKKSRIFCTSPPRVNICGKLNLMCFDKTGTLTEEGLDVLGFRYVEGSLFTDLHNACRSIGNVDIIKIMASCHSLKLVHGELIGDPLDLKMFQFTEWIYEDLSHLPSPVSNGPSPGGHSAPSGISIRSSPFNSYFSEICIIRTFEFQSSLRRMSVVVKHIPQSNSVLKPSPSIPFFEVYVKGAPEVMKDICKQSSFPRNYEELLREYTNKGYRVLACASKTLDHTSTNNILKLDRSNAECDLKFIGFVIFENKMKKGTLSVIEELNSAKIRQVMCTGDNILTAISVGKDCGIIPRNNSVFMPNPVYRNNEIISLEWIDAEIPSSRLNPVTLKSGNIYQDYVLAIPGNVYQYLIEEAHQDLLDRVLVKTQIFARMSPEQKHSLVERLHDLGYCVGFCGDGANDCGALKSADVGLSLSEAEASVAAPFTSQNQQLDCVPELMREGRAALVTSFSSFKYMALYSLTQFTSVSLMYSMAANMGDFQYLYIDILLIVPIATVMGYSKSFHKLSPKGPTASLLSKKVLTSLIGQIIIQFIFQLIAFYWVRWQPWYILPNVGDDMEVTKCYENTSVFLLSSFEYISIAVIFSAGPPYREEIWNNGTFNLIIVWFASIVPFLIFITTAVTIYPPDFLFRLLDLVEIPFRAKLVILTLAVLHFCAGIIFERRFSSMISQMLGEVQLSTIPVSDEESGQADSQTLKKIQKWKKKGKKFKIVQSQW